jgi:hypothetical protein
MIGYDSDTIDAIPADAALVNYYGDGLPGSATKEQLARFSTPYKYSITRKLGTPGYWGDVEPGCIWPISQAVTMWEEKMVDGLYVDYANWEELRDAVSPLVAPPYWVAEYYPTIPINPQIPNGWEAEGCVMWQYADPTTSGGHWDLSVTSPTWPVPVHTLEEVMQATLFNDYVGPDGLRRLSGFIDVPGEPGQVQLVLWTETAVNSNKFEWYALTGDTTNGQPPNLSSS